VAILLGKHVSAYNDNGSEEKLISLMINAANGQKQQK